MADQGVPGEPITIPADKAPKFQVVRRSETTWPTADRQRNKSGDAQRTPRPLSMLAHSA